MNSPTRYSRPLKCPVLFSLFLLVPMATFAQPVVPLAPGEILVSDHGQSAILRISADRTTVSTWMPDVLTPAAIQVELDGTVIFVHHGNTIRRVAHDGTWTDIPIGVDGASGVALATNGDLIVACDGEPLPVLWRLTSNGTRHQVSAGRFKSEDVEIDHQGNIVAVEEGGQLVRFLPTEDYQPGVILYSGFGISGDFLIEPDGAYVVADWSYSNLFRVAPDGTGFLVLADDLQEVEAVARLFNGDLLIVENDRYTPASRLRRVPYGGGAPQPFVEGLPFLVDHIAVVPWTTGFLPPVDNLPAVNRAKAGSAIPVKFNIGGNMGMNIFVSGYPQSLRVACEGGALQDDIEETVTAGSTSLSYDAASVQYVYVWKTDRAWAGTCRQLIVRLIDGSEHRANFTFTR